MLQRGQTTEERIAQIAQGFGQGFQNFQGQQDRQRVIAAQADAKALQAEALKRQRALDALNVAGQLSSQTGKFIDPSQIEPMISSGNLEGLGEILQSAPLSRKAELENETRQFDKQYKQSIINKNNRAPVDQFKKDEEKRKFQAVDTLRKEITGLPATKDLVNVDAALAKIRTAPDNAAGDMSKIFAYMKILDPGSTVREGEFANAEQARGIDSSIIGYYNKTLRGERLTPSQRRQFEQAAENLARSQFQTYRSVIAPQLKRVEELGLDRSQIFPNFSQQEIFDRPATQQVNPLQNAGRITDGLDQISPSVIQKVQSYTPEQAAARKQELLRKAGS